MNHGLRGYPGNHELLITDLGPLNQSHSDGYRRRIFAPTLQHSFLGFPRQYIPPSLMFDGINDYCTVNHDSAFSLNDGSGGKPMSWVIWLKPTALGSNHRGIIYKGPSATIGREYIIWWDSSRRIYVYLAGNNDLTTRLGRYTSVDPITTGNSYMLTFTYDGATTIKIYVNAVRMDIGSDNGGSWTAPFVSNNNIHVGRVWVSGNFHYYPGKVGVISIFNKELSLSEITVLYNNGNGRDARIIDGLVGYWKLNRLVNSNLIADSSGNDRYMNLAPSPFTPQLVDW